MNGYYIQNPQGIQSLGKASTRRARAAVEQLLGTINETETKLNIIRASVANAKEVERQSREFANSMQDAHPRVGRDPQPIKIIS